MSQNIQTVVENAARMLGRGITRLHTDRGMTVVTFLTDEEAAAGLLQVQQKDRIFATSLLSALRQYGSWTPGRRAWAHKLALEAMFIQAGGTLDSRPASRQENRSASPPVIIDMAGIMRLFKTALDAVRNKPDAKKPKITFAMEGGRVIVLAIAGERSKKPGTINVSNGRKYGEPDNVWYGRIDPETGAFSPSRDCDSSVVSFLKSFSEDPAGVAGRYGRITGFCCFCHRVLTRRRGTGLRCRALYSVDVGYGPDCAKRFGLPFGMAAAAAVESEQAVDANVREENEVESRLEEAASV